MLIGTRVGPAGVLLIYMDPSVADTPHSEESCLSISPTAEMALLQADIAVIYGDDSDPSSKVEQVWVRASRGKTATVVQDPLFPTND